MRTRPVVTTGAGRGGGAAVARAMAAEGWRLALVGRRREPLAQIAAEIPGALVELCDVGDSAQVAGMGQRVLGTFGSVEGLVNAAGTNVPRRALEALSL